MRIASDTLFRQAVSAMQRSQADLARTQLQLSSGQRIQRAGEDPSAFASAQRMDARLAANTGYTRAADAVQTRLSLAETRIVEAGDLINRARELTVHGNNAPLSAVNRESIVTELGQLRAQLLQTANAEDGSGRALFAGTANGPAYSVATDGSIAYDGNAGIRLVAISAGATIADGERGPAVFGANPGSAFDAIDSAIAALSEPDAALRAAGAEHALQRFDDRLEQLNMARSRIGTRLSALDRVGDTRAAESEQINATRSTLMDTDIAAAVTELAQAGNRLTAAQQSYLRVQQSSLFDLLR